MRVFGVVRTACLDDADEWRQAVEGRLAVRGRGAAVGRVLRNGIPHDRRLGSTCRDREAPDFRFGWKSRRTLNGMVMSYISVGHTGCGGQLGRLDATP